MYIKYIRYVLLLSVFLALLSLFLIVGNQPSSQKGIVEESGMQKIFNDVGALQEKATRVEINLPQGESFVLSKKDDQWFIESCFNVLADQDVVERFLLELSQLYGEIRYQGTQELETFQLVDENKCLNIRIETDTSKNIPALLVGKKSGLTGRFVRRHDSNVVYETSNEFIRFMGIKEDTLPKRIDYHPWLELYPIKLDHANVRSIEIISGDKTRSLKKDHADFTKTVNTIDSIKVIDAINLKEQEVDDKDRFIIITMENGRKLDLIFHLVEGDKEILMKVIDEGREAGYTIEQGILDKLFK